MATRVNTKFVLVIGGIATAVLIGLAVVATRVLNKSAETHLAEGQKLLDSAGALRTAGKAEEASRETEKAVATFGKAVSKDPNNAGYLKAWIGAMELTQPTTRQLYIERYNQQYLRALQRLADTLRTDIPAHKRLLDPILYEARVSPNNGAWNGLITAADTAIKRFDDKDAARDPLRRYRGIARVGLLKGRFDMNDADREAARADLEAALAANPKDELSTAALIEWIGFAAARIRATTGQQEQADKLIEEGRKRASDFIAASPPAGPVLHVLNTLDFQEGVRQLERQRSSDAATPRAPLEELVSAFNPRALRTLEAFSKTDASILDPISLAESARFAVLVGVPNALDIALAEMERAAQARNTDPLLLFNMGRLAVEARDAKRSIELMQKVADLPDRPLSFEGKVLFGLRDAALSSQARAALLGLDISKTVEEQKEWVAQAEGFRKKIEARAGGDAELRKSLLFIDGRLELVKNNLATARKLLADYSDQTNRTDPDALRLLTSVLVTLRDDGAARQQLERLRELGFDNSRTDELLADLEGRIGNRSAMIQALQRAATRESDPARRTALQQRADDLQNLDDPKQPAFKELRAIRDMLEKADPDIDQARQRTITLGRNIPDSPLARFQIGALLLQFGPTEVFGEYLKRLSEKAGERDNIVLRLTAMAAAPSTVDEAVKAIDENPGLDNQQKAVQKLVLFMQNGDRTRADAALDELEKINVDHPLVISNRFERAVADKKLDVARQLVDRAVAKNVDNTGGLIFKAQLAVAEGKIEDAVRFAEEATKVDKLSAGAWRVLGTLQAQLGRTPEAIVAFNQALQIRPDEVSTVVQLCDAYVKTGQTADALRIARAAKSRMEGNQAFQNYLLKLESEYGDAREATKRREVSFNQNPLNGQNTAEYLLGLLKSRDFERMDAAVVKLEKLEPVKDQALQYRALYHAAMENLPKAIEAFDQAIAAVPEDKRAGAEHFNFAQVALNAGLPEVAIAISEKGRKYQAAGATDLDRLLGDTYFKIGDFANASTTYRRALETGKSDPNNAIALRLADTLLRSGKNDDAAAVLSTISTTDDATKINVLLLRSQAEQRAGKFDAALVSINEVLKLDSRSVLGLIRRAEILTGNPATAANENSRKDVIADLEAALRLMPGNTAARRLLASVIYQQGGSESLAKAIGIMREGIRLDPDDGELRAAVVQDLIVLVRFDEAIAILDEAIARPGDKRQWYGMSGDIHARLGRSAQAAEAFGKLWESEKNPVVAERYAAALLAKTPPDTATARQVLSEKTINIDKVPTLLLVRARAAMLEGREADWTRDARTAWAATDTSDFGGVSAYFAQLLRQVFRRPGDARPRMADADRFIETLRPAGGWPETADLAIAIMRLSGDEPSKTRALASLKNIAENGKDNVLRYQARRMEAGELIGAKKYSEAIERYQQAEALNPGAFENLNDMAFVLGKHLGKYAEALPMAEKAAELAPANVYVLGTLGTIYLGLQKFDQAEKALIAARQLGGDSVQRASPLIRLTEVRLAKGDTKGAADYYRDLNLLIENEREPKTIRTVFAEDLEKLDRAMASAR